MRTLWTAPNSDTGSCAQPSRTRAVSPTLAAVWMSNCANKSDATQAGRKLRATQTVTSAFGKPTRVRSRRKQTCGPVLRAGTDGLAVRPQIQDSIRVPCPRLHGTARARVPQTQNTVV
jgi:hypothetical protein